MSGGRVDLGLGTGWYDDEHTAYGIPFPPLKERFEILEEQLEILTGMWRTPVGETFDFDGRHHTVSASPALPKPVQDGGPPIIIGGGGPKKTPSLAARFAGEFNLPFAPKDVWVSQRGRVQDACREIDRDPDELTYSVALGVCGTPPEAVARLQEWGEAGDERVYLQVLDLDDLDHIDVLGREVQTAV